MSNKKNPIGYIFAGLLGAIAGAVSVFSLDRLIPKLTKKSPAEPKTGKTRSRRPKK